MRIHLGDILSITTGALVSPDHIGGVYRILNHLTGDDLMTHQLPAACDAMKPHLVAQFPTLAAIQAPKFDGEAHVKRWLAEQVAIHGEWHEVTAPPSSVWGEHDAIQDLVDMVGADKVIGVTVSEDTDPAAVAGMVADAIRLHEQGGDDDGEASTR